MYAEHTMCSNNVITWNPTLSMPWRRNPSLYVQVVTGRKDLCVHVPANSSRPQKSLRKKSDSETKSETTFGFRCTATASSITNPLYVIIGAYATIHVTIATTANITSSCVDINVITWSVRDGVGGLFFRLMLITRIPILPAAPDNATPIDEDSLRTIWTS